MTRGDSLCDTLWNMATEVNEETVNRFYRALLPVHRRSSPETVQEALGREGFVVSRDSIRCPGDGSLTLSHMSRRYAFDVFDVVVHVVGGKLTRTARGKEMPPVPVYWDLTFRETGEKVKVDLVSKSVDCSIPSVSSFFTRFLLTL